jgi:hypothetical protein
VLENGLIVDIELIINHLSVGITWTN